MLPASIIIVFEILSFPVSSSSSGHIHQSSKSIKMEFASSLSTMNFHPAGKQPSFEDIMAYNITSSSSSSDHHHLNHQTAASATAAAAFAALMAGSNNSDNNSTPDVVGSNISSSSRRVSSSSVISTSSSSNRKQGGGVQKVLPLDFIPTPYTVVCGRGKRCSDNVGNRRLQVIASMFVGRYSLANRKEDKSEIVTEILNMVREACPLDCAAFVRHCSETNRWIAADNLCAREKIGTVLRDCLHSKYKSSTKSKLQRRKARKEVAKKAQLLKNLDKVRNPTMQIQLRPIPTKQLTREVSSSSSTSV